MENLLQNKTPIDDDEELERRIEMELQNYEYNEEEENIMASERSEYRFGLKNKNEFEDSFQASLDLESDAFKEWMDANRERDKELLRIEEKITKMKMANKNQFIGFDYETFEEKPLILKNQLFSEEKNNEIREKAQKELLLQAEKDEENKLIQAILKNSVNLEERDYERAQKLAQEQIQENLNTQSNIDSQKVSFSTKSHIKREEDELAARLEKAAIEREIMNMEREDQLSRDNEYMVQQNLFRQRLINLPDTFVFLKEEPSIYTRNGNKFWIGKLPTPLLTQPISNPLENLLESAKAKMESKELHRVTNKKRYFIKFHNVQDKDNALLQKKIKVDDKARLSFEEKETKQNIPVLLKTKLNNDLIKGKSKTSSTSLEIFLQKIHQLNNYVVKSIMNQKLTLSLSKVIQSIENLQSSQSYNFFFNGEEESANQEIDFGNEGTQKSLSEFLQKMSESHHAKHIKLELKMENIYDMKGLEELKYTRFLMLSMNKIKKIEGLTALKNLVEINLAQNEINSMIGLSGLKMLRFLNLEVNQITKIEGLNGCENLEVLNLNNNQIACIENLSELKKLKKLTLFRNKITKISGLDGLISLEELDLGRNLITEIEGINPCILLRKLILYYNQISKLPKRFSHLFLVELWLNGNRLQDLSDLGYLPSLEYLNCQENQISTLVTTNAITFLPSLRRANLSFNSIQSFGQLHRFLMKSCLIEELQINENPLMYEITSSAKDFYDYSLSLTLVRLKELNSSRFRCVEVDDDDDDDNKNIINSRRSNLGYFAPTGRFLDDYHYTDKVVANKFSQNKFSFNFQKTMSICKIVEGPTSFQKLEHLRELKYGAPIIFKHRFSNELFITDLLYRLALQKVKSFLSRLTYKRRKIKKYYQKNLSKVIKCQAFIKGRITRKTHDFTKRSLWNKAALKIQKVFRGYRQRKKYLKYKRDMENVKYDLGLEEDDLDPDFFNKEPDTHQFELKIPDGLQINQFIENIKFASMNQNLGLNINNKKTADHQQVNPTPNLSYIEEEKSAHKEEDHDDEYSVSSMRTGKSISEIRLKENRPIPKTEKYKKLAEEEWKISEEGAKEGFTLWQLKKDKLKNQKKKVHLTAEQRLQEFRKNNMRK